MALPPVADDDQLDAFVDDPAAVRAALDHVASSLGLHETLQPPTRGSALVGLGPTSVVKVFAPHDRAHAAIETACLTALNGELPVATPQLHGTGILDGWHWLHLSRLPGVELAEAWPTLSATDQLSLSHQLGEALGVLHRLAAPAAVPVLDWSAWLAERLPTLVETQRGRNCPEAVLDGLDAMVNGADLSPGSTGWLHTEVMREHLLVERGDRGWRLSGLFDFEPSWVGPVDYEFASVGLFFSAGQPELLDAVCRGAGVDPDPARLFAMAALHRYSNLGWYCGRLGGPAPAAELAERWFSRP